MDTASEIANALDREVAVLKAKAADYDARHRIIDQCARPGARRIGR